MIKENTSTVKTISANIFRHVNDYITEKHRSKEKNVIINGFQSTFKKKWKCRKLKFSRLLYDTRRNSFLTEAATGGVL